MEGISKNQKKSAINKVVGFGPEKEEEFLDYFQYRFESDSAGPKEKEMSLELKTMLARINDKLPDFLHRYGADAIEIPLENIHILDKNKIPDEELKRLRKKYGTENGFFSPRHQNIAMFKDYDEGRLSFLQSLIHEILHAEGFYSFQKSSRENADINLKKDGESSSMNIRRSGFSMGTKDGNRFLFHNINEAMITELAIRFEKEFFSEWPELAPDIQARDKYIELVSKRDNVPIEKLKFVIAGLKGNINSEFQWVSYSYHDERIELNALINELYKRNKSDFTSREDIFNLFAKATLTGRILPIAKLIEKTFGKGTFKIIGERSADKPAE